MVLSPKRLKRFWQIRRVVNKYGLREFMGTEKITVPVSKLAKYKTTVQLVALGVVIAEPLIPGMREVSDILLWLAAALTAITGWQYWSGVSAHMVRDEDDSL